MAKLSKAAPTGQIGYPFAMNKFRGSFISIDFTKSQEAFEIAREFFVPHSAR